LSFVSSSPDINKLVKANVFIGKFIDKTSNVVERVTTHALLEFY